MSRQFRQFSFFSHVEVRGEWHEFADGDSVYHEISAGVSIYAPVRTVEWRKTVPYVF